MTAGISALAVGITSLAAGETDILGAIDMNIQADYRQTGINRRRMTLIALDILFDDMPPMFPGKGRIVARRGMA